MHKSLNEDNDTAEDRLRLHDDQVRQLEMRHRNLLLAIEMGDDPSVFVKRLNEVDAELKEMRAKRSEIVPVEIELPEDLPELYRELVADIAAALSQDGIAWRAADELHELVERIIVDWDADANGQHLMIEGNLLEMLRKSAPSELDVVTGAIFAEVGCGRAPAHKLEVTRSLFNVWNRL